MVDCPRLTPFRSPPRVGVLTGTTDSHRRAVADAAPARRNVLRDQRAALARRRSSPRTAGGRQCSRTIGGRCSCVGRLESDRRRRLLLDIRRIARGPSVRRWAGATRGSGSAAYRGSSRHSRSLCVVNGGRVRSLRSELIGQPVVVGFLEIARRPRSHYASSRFISSSASSRVSTAWSNSRSSRACVTARLTNAAQLCGSSSSAAL